MVGSLLSGGHIVGTIGGIEADGRKDHEVSRTLKSFTDRGAPGIAAVISTLHIAASHMERKGRSGRFDNFMWSGGLDGNVHKAIKAFGAIQTDLQRAPSEIKHGGHISPRTRSKVIDTIQGDDLGKSYVAAMLSDVFCEMADSRLGTPDRTQDFYQAYNSLFERSSFGHGIENKLADAFSHSSHSELHPKMFLPIFEKEIAEISARQPQ